MRHSTVPTRLLGVCLMVAGACALAAEPQPPSEALQVTLGGRPAPPASCASTGLSLIAESSGPQLAVMPPAGRIIASLRTGENVEIAMPFPEATAAGEVSVEARLLQGGSAAVSLGWGDASQQANLSGEASTVLTVTGSASVSSLPLAVKIHTEACCVAVQLSRFKIRCGEQWAPLTFRVASADPQQTPPRELAALHKPIEEALIEWDWRMQDGINTPREPVHLPCRDREHVSPRRCPDRRTPDSQCATRGGVAAVEFTARNAAETVGG